MTQWALLFSDVVDSTALVGAVGDAAAARFWAEHDRRARLLLALHRGREIDRSDGFFLLFEQVADAAAFALGYHAALAGLGAAARVGLHVGTVALRTNEADAVARGAKPVEVDGLAKPLAARIMSLAGGGRTLLSAQAASALGAAPGGQVLLRHGHYRLKGVPEPVEVAELAAAGASPAPPGDGEKAYRVLSIDGQWRPVHEVRHNLAPERDAFVGRRAELGQLARRMADGVRLLTVLGPGGIGKTRLVRRYAGAWLGDWPGGVYFCDLSEARSADGIVFALSLALDVPLGRGDPVAQLGHAIAGRGRCLLILDNFEQVQGHAASTVGRWLDRAAPARFLVTSRERLHLPGEEVMALDPLALGADAVDLFVARARAWQPDLAVDEQNRATLAEIVRLLDGLPLAIELAAARTRLLSPAQIVQRMRDRFGLLAGVRGGEARQATLRSAIDWSWELLSAWEQAALAQCSVFDGGFTLEAAEAVLDLGRWPDAPPVLDLVQMLVDKSMLRVWVPAPGRRLDLAQPFFAMYLSIRDYAKQRLAAFGDAAVEQAEDRHARHFARFGTEASLDALLARGGIDRRRTLAIELDNVVGACTRAIARRQPELAADAFLAAWAVFEAQGPYALAASLGEQVAGLAGLGDGRAARLRLAVADAQRNLGRIAPAEDTLAQALVIARRTGDRRIESAALGHLATTCHRQGRVDEASRHFVAAAALLTGPDDGAPRGVLLANQANLQMEQGRMDEARETYGTALALHRAVGHRAAEGIALGNLGTLHHDLGRLDAARQAYDEALRIHREAGSRLQEAITLGNLGILLMQQGAHDEAAAQYAAALAIHRHIGARRSEGVVVGQMGELHFVRGQLDEAQPCLDEALAIHREVGNRRFEGEVLGLLADLRLVRGRPDAALEAADQGLRLLRDIDDTLAAAVVLCIRGRILRAGGDAAGARAALAEAEAVGTRVGAGAESALGRQLDRLRSALG